MSTEYSRRMNRVLDHIDRHLDQPLDLNELAEVANFSAYHFHRVFSEWLGETLGDYLQRRRLAVGAERLASRPDLPVLTIALSIGFGSGEAFARAFKRQFGMTPTAWRAQTPLRWADQVRAAGMTAQQRKHDHANSKLDQASGRELSDHRDSRQSIKEHEMNIRPRVSVVDLPPTKVAGLRKIGPYGAPVAQFWVEQFVPWMRSHGLENETRYGIPYDDRNVTTADKCRFDACVEVPDDFVANGAAMLSTLPGGRYALASVSITPSTISDAWTELLRGWLPSSGMQCDARPLFARYPKDRHIDPDTGVFDCDLCIPVRPL